MRACGAECRASPGLKAFDVAVNWTAERAAEKSRFRPAAFPQRLKAATGFAAHIGTSGTRALPGPVEARRRILGGEESACISLVEPNTGLEFGARAGVSCEKIVAVSPCS